MPPRPPRGAPRGSSPFVPRTSSRRNKRRPSSRSLLRTFRVPPSIHLPKSRSLCVSAWFFSSAGEARSEEHTSEIQSHLNIVCRLLLSKKKEIRDAVNPSDLPSHGAQTTYC